MEAEFGRKKGDNIMKIGKTVRVVTAPQRRVVKATPKITPASIPVEMPKIKVPEKAGADAYQ